VDEMCRKLLANTILEDYTIEAIEAERLPHARRSGK